MEFVKYNLSEVDMRKVSVFKQCNAVLYNN